MEKQQVHAVLPPAAHAKLKWQAGAMHNGSISAAVAEAADRIVRLTFAERDAGDPVHQARQKLVGLDVTPEQAQDLVGMAATRMVHSQQVCEDREPDNLLNAHLLPLERAILWIGARRLAVLVASGSTYLDDLTIADVLSAAL